jgi:hypothetical protein
MYTVELPKQLFKKFENCIYRVRIINNQAKCAAAIVEYSNKKTYKIEYTKPFVNKYIDCSNMKESLEFWVPTDKSTWQSINVPEELMFVVDRLRTMCNTSEEEITMIEEETRQVMCSFNE